MRLDPHSEDCMPSSAGQPLRLAVIGGGLAGLASAAGLAGRGYSVHLFEARRHWGGRAGSYREPGTSERVDHCQHVAMGCCTNFLDFCRRTGVLAHFRRDRELRFIGPDGRSTRFAAARWLPAPLHLAPALAAIPYLRWRDKIGIARAMWKLLRARPSDPRIADWTVATWLSAQRQTETAIERFWQVVLVSALGETLERASFQAAHKVFLDGFLAARTAYELWIPRRPLETLYEQIVTYLEQQGVTLHGGTRVDGLSRDESARPDRPSAGEPGWQLTVGSETDHFDGVVIATAWRRLQEVWGADNRLPLPHLDVARIIHGSPITAVHLWFDRPLFSEPHAVIVGRLSQWVFRRNSIAEDPLDRTETRVASKAMPEGEYYYQVVISASRSLDGRPREDVRDEVLGDLRALWPAAEQARLARWRMVTQSDAVFSCTPELNTMRPGQQTPYSNLVVAGDWTDTGWPSTMEGAVRSGYLAAERLMQSLGQSVHLLQPDLAASALVRFLARRPRTGERKADSRSYS